MLNTIRDNEAYRRAYQKPSETVQGVTTDLHASLAFVQPRGVPSSVKPTINYVDRRFIHGASHQQNGGGE